MQGLELSRLYYEEYCAPLLKMEFPQLLPRMAAGLAGEGSECLGFDDVLSRDHDWGPSCVYAPATRALRHRGRPCTGAVDAA